MRVGWKPSVILPIVVTIVAALECPARSAEPSKAQLKSGALPSRALILGVPFISWYEASLLDYYDKPILNPSFAASLGMVLRYWGQDLSLLKKPSEALPFKPGGWGIAERGNAKSLDELRSYIARGIPLMVSPAITAVAHPLSPVHAGLAAVRGFKFKPSGPLSGVLIRMASLDTFRQLEELLNVPVGESLLVSERVVIGYDDDRKVIILHDPSFGPAWEVIYEDFVKMWGFTKNVYIAAYPPNFLEVLARRPPAAPYPPRTPDKKAAVSFIRAYALSSIGQVVEAEEELKKGLAIPGISVGYQHLFLFELALHHATRGETWQARTTAQKAIDLLPEHHRPWMLLAAIDRGNPVRAQEAVEAEKKAKALCTDQEAQRKVANVLSRDFSILSCPSPIQSGQLSEASRAITFHNRGMAYRRKGEYDRAIQDFDQAIQLNPKDAGTFNSRGIAQFDRGQFGAAVPDFAKAAQLAPANEYSIIWLYLAQSRAGQSGRDSLASSALRLDLKQWPVPVISMYLGKITSQAVLEAATDADSKKQGEKRCEAYFYVGQHLLIEGLRDEAARMFQAAVATGVTAFYEYHSAKAELKRMGY